MNTELENYLRNHFGANEDVKFTMVPKTFLQTVIPVPYVEAYVDSVPQFNRVDIELNTVNSNVVAGYSEKANLILYSILE